MTTQNEPNVRADDSRSPTPNPIAQSSSIYVSVPEELEIRLVDASVLADYEVWIGLTTILITSTVSSFVAWLGNRDEIALAIVSGVFFLMTWLTGAMVVVKRRSMGRTRQAVRYGLGEVVSDEARRDLGEPLGQAAPDSDRASAVVESTET